MESKLLRIMNIMFYVITFICIVFTFQSLFVKSYDNERNSISFWGILILLFYLFSYYCHKEIQENVLKTFYIEKNTDNTTPIEDFCNNVGLKYTKSNLNFTNNIFDLEGLDEEDLLELQKQVDYIKKLKGKK